MMWLLKDHCERRARAAADSIRASGLSFIGPTRTELFELMLAPDGEDTRALPLLRLLFDENEALRGELHNLSATLHGSSRETGLRWPFPRSRIMGGRMSAKSKLAATADPSEQLSWQEVHRRDTDPVMSVPPFSPFSAPRLPSAIELRWAGENVALVHLLRTGQWQPVPSSPPDCWVQRFVTEVCGLTAGAARKVLTTALEAAPHPARAVLPEPLSAMEREWLQQNNQTVHGLYSGQLRGIPMAPSRSWAAAFQSAIGGTLLEISAILAIVVNIALHTPSTAVAAE